MPGNPWMIGPVAGRVAGEITVAVKDLLDVAGTRTTVGSPVRSELAPIALEDVAVVSRLKAAGARIVAKANMVELAYGSQGLNPGFGTPVNPRSPELIPGGSSSGSAVAVGIGVADVGVGTDTGGSIRIPAACCGVYGLKTTHGSMPMDGCWPLAPSLDTIGPLAASLEMLVEGFRLLGGDLSESGDPPAIRVAASGDESFDSAVERVAESLGLPVKRGEIDLGELWRLGDTVMGFEAVRSAAGLDWDRIDPRVGSRLRQSQSITPQAYLEALGSRSDFQERFERLLDGGESVLILPTVPFAIPELAKAYDRWLNVMTLPFNYLGVPALAMPVSDPGGLVNGEGKEGTVPLSLQLVGVAASEGRLLALAGAIEAATRA